MSDPITLISDWFEKLLLGWGLAENLVNLINSFLGALIIASLGFGLSAGSQAAYRIALVPIALALLVCSSRLLISSRFSPKS